jgi:hypothetical protein
VHAPSRMTRAPLLRLSGADGGSCFTVLGVDADDRDADLADADRRTPTRRIGMPSAVVSTSSRGTATASVAVAAASRGPASSRARCA